MGIYEKAKTLGIEVDHHGSDLYLPVTEETQKLVAEHRAAGGSATIFTSQVDKKPWYDIPFHYTPWWEERLKGR